MRRRSNTAILSLATLILFVGALLASGCSPKADVGAGKETRSQETTLGEFPKTAPPSAQAPPPPMLREPRTAIYSYLTWISYAYRVLDSSVASQTFSIYEEVRINSYVQLNKQEGRAIDQRLTDFQVLRQQIKGDKATVGCRESWSYRYIDIATGKYKGEPNTVSYDSTYTVVNTKGKGWLVDKVQVEPVGKGPK